MSKKKVITLLLTLAMILSLSAGVSAAETTEAKVPITLTVVNTVTPISCTVPACLPVSLVDGYVLTANNAMITNTAKNGAIRVTKVDVQAGTFEIGNFDDFTASKNSIALSINGCSTKGAGSLTLVDGAFPAIAAEKNLAIRYKAKVSASEAVTNINAASILIFRKLIKRFARKFQIRSMTIHLMLLRYGQVIGYLYMRRSGTIGYNYPKARPPIFKGFRFSGKFILSMYASMIPTSRTMFPKGILVGLNLLHSVNFQELLQSFRKRYPIA